jgi:hypothetical protein
MPASYPTSAKVFTTKSDGPGNTILAAHINDLQLEVTAIEQDLIAGLPVSRGGTGKTSATANRMLIGSGGSSLTETAIIYPTVSALVDGANVALNAALGNVFTLSAGGDRTMSTPTNPIAGQKIIIAHTASGADRTLSLTTGSSGAFRFGTDIPALTATASGKTDYIGCVYNGTDSRWDVVAYVKGY